MEKFDQSYIEMAGVWARNSYCKRRQVGALIVKDRMIISDGYNGTPSGFENICEDETGLPSRMFCMLRLMQFQKLRSPATAARMQLCMSQHRHVWNVQSLSSSPV